MTDLLFTQPKTQQVKLTLLGKSNKGIRLYQKLLVLMLSDKNTAYREAGGTILTSIIGKANALGQQAMLQIGSAACADALRFLDAQDRACVQSLQPSYQNGSLVITLKLSDGSSYTGELNI